MDQRKRAWLYCRIDAPEDEHGRLKGQKKELTDYAEQMGFEIAGVSQDTASSLRFERNGLVEVTEAAAAGKMDVLLIINLSRLGRDAIKTLDFIRWLHDQGIRVYSPMEGEITVGVHGEIGSKIISTLNL
ncbi:recombinase family protein [Petroclostridium xylanilyticum]|jgi:DNA invertase Pin-like site-specific DNA recombinase|uniref:recombinase family protein n=1 Tax=Petroclostridium xylanilyticum TaxID=1792311 RepID=UPI000B98A522|nr:recombinase family protein [Petroclostridium xylanilyticum]